MVMATGMIERRLVLVRREGGGLGWTDPWEHVCDVGKMAPRWGTIQTGVVSDLRGWGLLLAAWVDWSVVVDASTATVVGNGILRWEIFTRW